jgi:hypothetical protein
VTNNSIFVLDANVFMQASRRYYAFDLAPKFWDSLILHARNGKIESIDHVKNELDRGNDELATWAKVSLDFAFISTDDNDVITSYREIMEWANAQAQFTDAAKASFASEPDGWLVAYAKAKGREVVTQEVSAPLARNNIKIPNVCQAFNVPFVDTFEMLRRLGVRFA